MQSCFHEAGHAVIAHALGGRVQFVSVAPDGSGLTPISLSDPKDKVVGRLAGRPAERRYCDLVGGCPPECDPSLHDCDDRREASAAAELTYPGDPRAIAELLTGSGDTATQMVEAEWSRIESVARAVYESPNGRLLGSVFFSMMEAS